MELKKIKPHLGVFGLALILTASMLPLVSSAPSEIKISTKTPEAFKETTKKLISSLPPSDQESFREAFVIFVRSKASSEKEIEDIIKQPPQYLHGLTASDIFREGRKVASTCAESGDCPGVLLESKYR